MQVVIVTKLKVLLLHCCVALQDGQVAETKTKLRAGDTLVVSTVAGNVQLNFLRRFLNEGFQVHLQDNELLHQASLSSSNVSAACTVTSGLHPGLYLPKCAAPGKNLLGLYFPLLCVLTALIPHIVFCS